MTDKTSSAAAFFDAQADAYEAPRRRLVPSFDAFYGWAIKGLELCGAPPRRVLDLGAGTGLLAGRVAAAYPSAELVLTDGAPAMLEQARERLGDGVQTVVADLRDPLPEGPFDAVVSALAIHHLADDNKRALFARISAALPTGGVFVNAEQVLAPSPWLDEHYVRWHHEQATAAGTDEDEWAASLERMTFDRCSDVESQLRWLREAGFEDVGCLYQEGRFAVMVARRAS